MKQEQIAPIKLGNMVVTEHQKLQVLQERKKINTHLNRCKYFKQLGKQSNKIVNR